MKIYKIIKWTCSFLRLIKYKLIFRKNIEIQLQNKKKPPYIGKNCDIFIDKNSKLIIKSGTYISPYCKIGVYEQGIIQLDEKVYMGMNCRLICRERICIGENVLLADNVSVYDHDHNYTDLTKSIGQQGYKTKKVNISKNCWLATNVTVLKGTDIGERVIIGANSVAINKIDGYGVYIGNPLRKIKEIM